jgi:hypothetical protein
MVSNYVFVPISYRQILAASFQEITTGGQYLEVQ